MDSAILLLGDEHVRLAWVNFITDRNNNKFIADRSLTDKIRLLENEYNATLILDGKQARLKFKTSQDALVFMIKWS